MSSMDSFVQQAIPQFSINKIFVGNREVRLTCSMRRSESFDFSSWNGIGNINVIKYLDFHAVITGGTTGPFLQNMFYPENRISFLSANQDNILSWEETLSSRSYGLNGHTKINILDVFNGHTLQGDPLSDPGQTRDRDPSSSSQASHNIHFEIIIETLEDITPRAQGLDVLAFCQLDIRSLSEEWGLQEFVGSLVSVGGPLIYEKALARIDGHLTVPTTRGVFTLSNGQFWSGPSHYKSEPNDSDSYVGWLTGPPTDDTTRRKRLQRREILNTKVASNIFINAATSFQYDGYFSDSGFFGNMSQMAAPYGNLTFGENIINSLLSDVGILQNANPGAMESKISKLDRRRLKTLAITSEKNENLNLFDNSVDPALLSSINVGAGDAPHYMTIFVMHYEQLIRSNSRFGYLMDFHREAVINPDDDLPGQNIVRPSREIISDILNRENINSFRIYRKRMTNLPVGNNKMVTNDFESYDTNEEEKFLTSIYDDTSPGARNHLAHLQAIDNLIDTPAGYMKTYSLSDYDLFSNYSCGNYEYIAEIIVEDPIRAYLVSKYTSFKNLVKKFSDYIKVASQPFTREEDSYYYIKNQFEAPRSNQPRSGNYDFHMNDFTQDFKNSSNRYTADIESLVSAYVDILYFLTKKEWGMWPANYDNMLRSLLPTHGSLDNMKFFLDVCMRMSATLKKLIYKNDLDMSSALTLGTGEKYVSKDLEYPDHFICARAPTNSRVDASSKFDVLFSADPPEANEIRAFRADLNAAAVDIDPTTEIFYPSEYFVMSESWTDSQHHLGLAEAFPGQEWRPASYQKVAISTRSSVMGDRQASQDAALIRAAVSGQLTKRRTQSDAPGDTELDMFDNLLYGSAGTTFGTLLSGMMNISLTKEDLDKDSKGEVLTKNMQESIFNSIITSENGSMFEQQMEQKYKNLFISKKSLGALYGVVTSAISADKLNGRSKNRLSFGTRLRTGDTNLKNRKRNIEKNKVKSAYKTTSVTLHRLDGFSGLDNDSKRKNSSTSILIQKVAKNGIAGTRLANSIKIAGNDGPSNNRRNTRGNTRSRRGPNIRMPRVY